MFTGIIEELGRVREVEKRGEDARIVIEARTVTEGARDGDSIAVNGVCLTALEVQPDSFAADVSKETLFRSTRAGSFSAPKATASPGRFALLIRKRLPSTWSSKAQSRSKASA